MIVAIADTHAVVWYLFNNPKLSVRARQNIDGALQVRNHIGVSSISVAEMVYLVEKGRIPHNAVSKLLEAFSDSEHPLQEIPFDNTVAVAMQMIRREDIPDMPDRIIAATSLRYGFPLISRDGKIRSSSIQTIW